VLGELFRGADQVAGAGQTRRADEPGDHDTNDQHGRHHRERCQGVAAPSPPEPGAQCLPLSRQQRTAARATLHDQPGDQG
jgi:hypothetical protein